MKLSASLEYLSSGCNRSPASVCWSNDAVAYGSSSNVVVYSSKLNKAILSLSGHRGRVNCVSWLKVVSRGSTRFQRSAEVLVSGSADNTVIVWKTNVEDGKLVAKLEGHTGPVTALATLLVISTKASDKMTLIATTSTDSSLRIWQQKNLGKFVQVQIIPFGRGFALSVDLAVLTECDGEVPFLVCGCDDSILHCYVWHGNEFNEVLALSGHGDWIRGVDMTVTDKGSIMLASCSQDSSLRLWSIAKHGTNDNGSDAEQEQIPKLQTKQNTFLVNKDSYTEPYLVQLESVLLGHEDWIYSAQWHPPLFDGDVYHQPMCLLTASVDKTMVIWRLDDSTGMWIDSVRVGNVGGNTLGFYGAVFSGDGKSILGHDYQGAFHLWTMKQSESQVNEKWERSVTISGHFGSVQSITWAPGKATYLLSASRDYTTRLHAPWKRNGKVTWHEIARPQVHGYEMQFIVSLSDKQFASAGDEKVIRIFEAPQSFHNSYLKISGKNIDDEKQSKAVFANVPALGLSNKAFYPGPDETEQEPVVAESDVASKQPPMEDEIIQSTLWPETRKLYGHGFEVFCLTTHPSGKLLASACKASKHEYAVIRIWDCGSWKQLQTLVAHSLTVTQMAYSNSGDRLLAVSRDRTWSVWCQSETKEKGFVLEQHADKKTVLHTRIIWTCSWSPDDKYFVTGSRDRKIIVWKNGGAVTQQWSLASDVFVAHNAVTAIDFCSQQIDELNGVYLLAVGLESGQLSLFSWQCKQKYQLSWNKLLDFNSSLSHSACVKQVQWHKEMTHFNSSKHLMLATCGEDYAVKIIDIAIQQD